MSKHISHHARTQQLIPRASCEPSNPSLAVPAKISLHPSQRSSQPAGQGYGSRWQTNPPENSASNQIHSKIPHRRTSSKSQRSPLVGDRDQSGRTTRPPRPETSLRSRCLHPAPCHHLLRGPVTGPRGHVAQRPSAEISGDNGTCSGEIWPRARHTSFAPGSSPGARGRIHRSPQHRHLEDAPHEEAQI